MFPDRIEAGCDEAGRGCLAGPVFAAAVILPPHFRCDALNDSKQLTGKMRRELRPLIERHALSYAVASCTPEEIDEMNILWASVAAMHKALAGLKILPDHILIDGNRFRPFREIPHTCVVKGDGKYMSIAQPRYWPRATVTSIWRGCTGSFHSMVGITTKDIPPLHTARRSGSTASRLITGRASS